MSCNEEVATKVNVDCDQVSIHSTRSDCSNEDIGDPPIQNDPTKWRKRFILLCALIFGIIIPAAIGTFVMLWWLEAYERTVTGMMTSMQTDLKIMVSKTLAAYI